MSAHHLLLNTGLRQKSVATRETSQLDTIHWTAETYNLHKSRQYNSLSEERQNLILKRLNENTLLELIRIERVGTELSRCMSDHASNDDEHLLYAMISGEEVNHYLSLASFVSQEAIQNDNNPLVDLVGQVMHSRNKAAITFTLQVVLEGFALGYVRHLKQQCRSVDLQNAFNMIIQDEARHHGTGMITFKEQQESSAPWDLHDIKTLAPLKGFLNLFQIGPLSIVQAVDKYSEGLTSSQRMQLFEDLEAEQGAQNYLEDLKRIMLQARVPSFVDDLEAQGYFKTYSMQDMNNLLQGA